ncbi:MAG: hypothetical protein ACKVH0_05360 [Alphaproteobacteria bacterium]
MKHTAISFVLALLAAGCRAGFPSLNDAPVRAPPELVAARDAGPVNLAEMRAVHGQTNTPDAGVRSSTPTRPDRLLASLPADAVLADPGVLDRAIAEAQSSGRTLAVVGIGGAGRAAADTLAEAIRSRGVDADVSFRPSDASIRSWVELYLAS